MTEVGVHEAKTRLSELLRAVERGEDVVVTRGGEAVARLVPIGPARTSEPITRFGLLAGEITDPGDWDEDDGDDLGDLFGLPRAEPA